MKKQLLFFFVGLFLINSVLALNCQYTETEKYTEFGTWIYNSDGDYFGEPLELKDFVSEYMNIEGCNPRPSFKIYNPYDFEIEMNIFYTSLHPNINWAYPESEQKHITSIILPPYSEQKIEGTCLDIGNNYIPNESISYIFIEPDNLILKKGDRPLEREICKLCGNEICLNDGTSCNPLYDDAKCGSGVCNIVGFCGSQKVVDCPNGKLNCQDKICLESSTKEEGESYMCSFECKSDRFDNGTCLKSSLILQQEEDKRNKNFIIFGVIVLIILSAGVGYFAFFKRKKEEKLKNQILEEKNSLLDEIDNLKKDKEDLQSSIKSLSSEIENMNLLISKGKDKISSLKKEIKDTEGKAKEELEKRLRFEEQRQKDRISKLTKQREMLEKEEQKIITIEKDLGSKKLKFEKENKEFFIKKALDKYKQRYPNIFYDEEEGYIKFSNNGDYLHRFIYRRKFDKNLGNKVVHHIDTDKLNNDDYNLISIPYERHKELNHTLIDFKDWESGIKQLKEQLDMEDSDFPEHIQKKIEEIRRQKRLGAYARKSRRKR
ncbi:hypothetical protein COT60_01300 [Candidatus Pacearchaeota archaeon CG09_land_8_20_14_0_10_30_9]|nr:MAG: hypothetical protein AUJ61_03245 [Candidatus Pacearchaeota archaeon CG1_02_30_18]PIO01279.1 MAG: hypothetical protein COT60_01300 [Candidatus Pacearchaeota archaeon CG09_land_8_20_14_0_10_30_9]